MFARTISPYISKYLKEVSPQAKGGEILIRNEAAAAGRKGYNMVFNAKPDGYTIGSVDSSVVTDNFLETPEIDYTKFTYLSRVYIIKRVVISHMKGFKNWDEVVNEMKKGPVKMGVGAFGRGNHVSAIILNEKVGTRFKLIPFPGLAETMGALIRGDVQVVFSGENAAMPLIEANEIRMLLMFSEASEQPGVVTIKQLGYPELAEQFGTYRFIIAPPGLEPEKKNILIAAIKKATADPGFVDWAKKARLPLAGLYGSEAENLFLKQVKFFEGVAPILTKNLK
jgi:tripartite-type tricarboxylate transporter receptor subunit TctC